MSIFRKILLIVLLSGLIVACQQDKPVTSPEPSPELNVTLALPATSGSSSSPEYPPPAVPGGQSDVYPAPSGEGVNPESPNPYPLPEQAAAIPVSGYEPSPEDQNLQRGEVFLEMADSKIMSLESYPLQVNLVLKGNLPTPCHMLRVVITSADAENRLQVEVYSVVDPNKVCTQVLEPFEATIPLGSYASGKYSVYINGKLLGEFGS